MMLVLMWILFGLVVGVIAKLITPGREPGGFAITALLGIGGALVGGRLVGVGAGVEVGRVVGCGLVGVGTAKVAVAGGWVAVAVGVAVGLGDAVGVAGTGVEVYVPVAAAPPLEPVDGVGVAIPMIDWAGAALGETTAVAATRDSGPELPAFANARSATTATIATAAGAPMTKRSLGRFFWVPESPAGKSGCIADGDSGTRCIVALLPSPAVPVPIPTGSNPGRVVFASAPCAAATSVCDTGGAAVFGEISTGLGADALVFVP